MARQPLEAPDQFARLVASAIKREMGDARMSGRTLAGHLGKSEKYARERLNGTFEFTLNDIERFCEFIGVQPEVFIGRIERDFVEEAVAPMASITPIRSNDGGYLDDAVHEQGLQSAATDDDSQADDTDA